MIAIIALIAVLAMGHTRFGAKRWLPILGGLLQVSELVKLIIIIVLARFFSEVRTEQLSLADLIKAAALVGLPLALIMLQPDLGTALVLGAAGGCGGVSRRLAMETRPGHSGAGRDHGAGGLSFSEALPKGTCYNIPAAGRGSHAARGIKSCNRRSPWVPVGFGARDLATEARIN